MEFELIKHGLRLRDVGSEAFTWRDLWVIVVNLPADSNLLRAISPEAARIASWTQTAEVAASACDWLGVISHQLAGSREGVEPYPRPYARRKSGGGMPAAGVEQALNIR